MSDYLKKIVPKEFHEIADAIIDHFGDTIKRIPPDQFLAGCLGAYAAYNENIPVPQQLKNILIGFISGMIALKGLTSMSEIVSISCLLTLASFGAIILFKGISGIKPGYNEEAIEAAGGRPYLDIRIDYDETLRTCPEGYFLSRDSFGELRCYKKVIE